MITVDESSVKHVKDGNRNTVQFIQSRGWFCLLITLENADENNIFNEPFKSINSAKLPEKYLFEAV